MMTQKPQAIGDIDYLVNTEDFKEEKVIENHEFSVPHVIFYMRRIITIVHSYGSVATIYS
jgi:hypothetical protein